MKRFFTSDEHYYHANMIHYTNRPVKDINELHRLLINNHNQVVSKEDITYHIGDFGFFKQAAQMGSILSKLNGTHVLVLGNHDEFNPFVYERFGFRGVHTSLELDNGWILVHDPSKACTKRDRQFITGHLHSPFEFRQNINYFDIGVDGNNYFPISEVEIKAELGL